MVTVAQSKTFLHPLGKKKAYTKYALVESALGQSALGESALG